MGFVSDWDQTSLSLRAASVRRRHYWSIEWRRRVQTKAAISTGVRINCEFFLPRFLWFVAISNFVMILIRSSWLIWCSNFSGIVLDVKVGTGRKSMLSTCKTRLWRLMRVHPCMKSEPAEEGNRWRTDEEFICFSWNWSRNPYSVEMHCSFSLFSAIWDCLHCIKALIN